MLPNLVVIGAMKCATTSLHHYLDLHPQIAMARERGLDFFLEDRFGRGVEWYAAQFRDAPLRGDTSPRYTNDPLDAGVPERMAAVLPNARLVYVVRDPVERIVSHYTHYVAAGYEDRSLEQALGGLDGAPERNPYVCRSLYRRQLDRYLGVYPLERIRVIHYEDLRDRRRETLAELFRFLGVDPAFEHPAFDRVHHRTAAKRRPSRFGRWLGERVERPLAPLPQDLRVRLREILVRPWSQRVARPDLDPALRDRLRELLQPDADGLRALTGRSSFPDDASAGRSGAGSAGR